MLELKNVSKRFGGVVATDDITLDVKRGEVHALIGPNGAGKTTLIGQISGSLGSDSGEILFEGRDITQATQHVRVRAGLARSYQITSLFKRFTVLDQQHGDACADALEERNHVLRLFRSHARHRLVEEHEPGVGGERQTHFERALFTVRERGRDRGLVLAEPDFAGDRSGFVEKQRL